MGRYHILLNKIPEVTPEENIKVRQFGFEQDFQSRYKETQKKQRLFHLNVNERTRIGIVHEEGRKDIFSGSTVHFYGRRRFFCKSTSHRTALCCSSTYSGNHPTLRIAMPIIQYGGRDLALLEQHTALNYEIMPWVFGKIIFNRIKEMNNISPVEQFDLFVSTNTNGGPFNQYDIQLAGSSFWRQRSDNDKKLILQAANSLRQAVMSYLAEDLDENAIETLLSQPPTTWQESPRRERVEADFFPGPLPVPRELHAVSEPTSLIDRYRDIDSILEGL
jgi:hypothetical protein